MDPLDTYNALPLSIDPSTKAISSTDPALAAELEELNQTVRQFVTLDTPNQVPPPPAPVKPQRSAAINKMKESGNDAYKTDQFDEAIKRYGMAIKMAADRPAWEASGLVREELSTLYNNRSLALMSAPGRRLPEAAIDAEISVEMKKVGNVKAWWRRGQCLKEMGRLQEAADWVKGGLDLERMGPEKGNIGQLESLLRDIEKAMGQK